jgi:cysteinyl-tRNA synthetase
MALQLYNTLSGKIEEFKPREDNLVRMYACGLTVYDYGHIGNFAFCCKADTASSTS